MKLDVVIIRIIFILLLALMGYLLNPLSQTTHLSEAMGRGTRQFISAIFGIIIALLSSVLKCGRAALLLKL